MDFGSRLARVGEIVVTVATVFGGFPWFELPLQRERLAQR